MESCVDYSLLPRVKMVNKNNGSLVNVSGTSFPSKESRVNFRPRLNRLISSVSVGGTRLLSDVFIYRRRKSKIPLSTRYGGWSLRFYLLKGLYLCSKFYTRRFFFLRMEFTGDVYLKFPNIYVLQYVVGTKD